MKNLPCFPTILGLFACLFFFSPQKIALATETYTAGTILFFDDFNDGNFNGWIVESGNWLIGSYKELMGFKNGKLLLGKINTGSSNWDNYQIELDARNNWGIDESIGFRRADDNNYYEVVLRYALNGIIGFEDAPEVILQKKEAGVTSRLFSTHDVILITGNQQPIPYHIKIYAAKEHLQLWIDDTLVFDLTDTGTKVKSGSIFFSYWTGNYGSAVATFDNVKVTALSKVYYPVIFIPGIGGSEFQLSQDYTWAQEDGHGGTFSNTYLSGEKVWVNEEKAAMPGKDDYFDVLRLKPDGQTSEAPLELSGNLTPFGYSDIDSFFSDMGYTKGTNFFVFPYDWRKDIKTTESSLDTLVEEAKLKSGMPKVNIVAHSMGGLVARNYIANSTQAAKVNKLIELGVPHLGSVDSLKAILYGTWFAKDYYLFKLGLPPSETYDVSQNLPAAFQLLPSKEYYNFYDNSDSMRPFPFRDDRDIDNNQITGSLNSDQTKTLMKNLNRNMAIFNLGEQFHNALDPLLNNLNGTKVYEIVGSGKDTIGQIRETWLITWPINLIPIQDEVKIDGDKTVPTYSASLKSPFRDISGGAQIYYVKQEHEDLVSAIGPAMQTVKFILNEGDSLPIEVKDQKISLEGQQLSVFLADLDLYDDAGNHTGLNGNGEIETNIPNTSYDKSNNSTHAFIDKSANKVTAKIKSTNTTKAQVKIRNYSQDSITKTILYNDVPVSNSSTVELIIDQNSLITPTLSVGTHTILASSEVTGNTATDQTPPNTSIQISGTQDSSGTYTGPIVVTLTGNDSESGVLKIEYSLDNGQTVQIYAGPFTVTTPGTTTIQFTATDKLGNEEEPQTFSLNIISPTPTSTPTTSSNNTSADNPEETNLSTSPQTSLISQVSNLPEVLGISTKKTAETVQDKSEGSVIQEKTTEKRSDPQLLLVLIIPAIALTYLPLNIILSNLMILRFILIKPTPKKMNNPKPKEDIYRIY